MEITPDAVGVPQKIVMRKPWDMHTHLRQGDMLKLIVPMTAKRFFRFVAMPNTLPPITTNAGLDQYRFDIMEAVVWGISFGDDDLVPMPLMTFYLTDNLDPKEVEAAVPGNAIGVKYYPHGLTTNSDSGVADPASLWTPGTRPYEVLRVLAEQGGTLLLHAADGVDENGKELGPYDQEVHFLLGPLERIRAAHPDLCMTVEHLSTAYGANYMRTNGGPLLGCTITAHHLLLDQRDVFRGGMHPHLHCWPAIQPEKHKLALRQLVSEGHNFVFLGSDSAPHPVGKKECECVLGGLFTAPAALELYAEAFEDMGCLERLEAFASINGPAFYNLAPEESEVEDIGYVTLVRKEWVMNEYYDLRARESDESYRRWASRFRIRPFRAGETVRWKLIED